MLVAVAEDRATDLGGSSTVTTAATPCLDLNTLVLPLLKHLETVTSLDQQNRKTLSFLQEELSKTLQRLTTVKKIKSEFWKDDRRNAVIPHEQEAIVKQVVDAKNTAVYRSLKLVAVYPCTVFSEKESKQTALDRLFGASFVKGWKRIDPFVSTIRPLLLVAGLVSLSCLLGIVFPGKVPATQTRWIYASIQLTTICLLMLWRLNRCNAKMLFLTCKTFDYCFLCWEVSLLAISVWAVADFDVPIGIVNLVGGSSLLLSYAVDAYSTHAQRRMAIILTNLCWIGNFFLIFWALFYGGGGDLFSRKQYFINVSSSGGTVSTAREDGTLSFSLTDFCLNRMINASILCIKLVYHAIKHEHDLVLIRSRVRRLME